MPLAAWEIAVCKEHRLTRDELRAMPQDDYNQLRLVTLMESRGYEWRREHQEARQGGAGNHHTVD